jgi:hypothetical protein
MKITDLEGREIEIADGMLALLQADDYRHYRLSGEENSALNEKMREYWEDFYQKLLLLEKS